VIVSGLGIGIVLLGIRSRTSGVRNLILAVVIGVVAFTGLHIFANWHEHRNDFGDPDDFTKPWRNGALESSPGSDAASPSEADHSTP
jgi:hypothetical protein